MASTMPVIAYPRDDNSRLFFDPIIVTITVGYLNNG